MRLTLTQTTLNELRSALIRYTNAARKVTGGRGRPVSRKSGGAGSDAKAIRMWAIDNGLQVNTRGRIQADIVKKYLPAH
ncbi:Lsr2 family DNA-binding protein [Arthrobacter globiformis]|uniref:Lsr2 family DNA-binding protein n=1 Tax=Arthrobacter globiformis TaxID=1665 RepID=UPI0027D7FFAC|nr:histone-like nucleoid-structuring protein Lsr2 [Arthrobacter globiformis]